MKKLLVLITLLMGSISLSHGQTYLKFSILFLDSNQNTLVNGGLKQVVNTDSSTAGIAFMNNYFNTTPNNLTDSVLVPNSYSGNSISFYYLDCTGYHYFDTTFTLSTHLNVIIRTGCPSPCNAEFGYSVDHNGYALFANPNYGFGYTETWDFGNGQSSIYNSPNVQYNAIGSYTVTHTISNSVYNCSDTVTKIIQVYDSCIADFTYTTGTNYTVDFVGYHLPNTIANYWRFGDSTTGTGDSVSHTYASASSYNVTYIVETSLCRDSIIKTVTLNTSPTYLTYSLLFLDTNLDTLQVGGLHRVLNTDSATVGLAFNKSYSPGPFGYIYDSIMIPSSYQGNQISFLYNDCNINGRHDTTFILSQHMGLVFYTNCTNPCNANFSFSVGHNGHTSFASAGLNSNYTQSWNFGNGQSSTGNSPSTQYTSPGNYLVTHIVSYSNINCYDSVTHTVQILDSCTAMFIYTMDSNTTVDFVGIPYPSTANSYWRFGDTTTGTGDSVSHTYASKANYDVTYIVETASCRDSIVKTVVVNTYQNCDSRFSMNFVTNFKQAFTRTDSSSGTSNWIINGVLASQAHHFTFSTSSYGNFTAILNVTDSANNLLCSSNKTFYFSACGLPHQLGWVSGQVTFNGTARTDYDTLKIFLIASDTVAGTLTLIDSAILLNLDSGYYHFRICDPYQRFLVKAALMSGSSIYSSFIPSYHPSNVNWSGATHFYGNQNLTNANIDMIAGTNPGGPGFIGGLISQGANKKFKPLDDIQVNLFDDANNPVAFALSKDGGKYEFANLAYGTYVVVVEELGKTSASYTVTLDSINKKFEGGDFEVNSTYVSLLSTGILKQELSAGLYPNPCNDVLLIDWLNENAEQVELNFYGLDGKLLKTISVMKEGAKTQIDVSELPQGLMLLRIIGEKGQSSHLIQKF